MPPSNRVRTLGQVSDARKRRKPAGALLELSVLATEKELLIKELERWRRREVEIMARIAEIQHKEQRLQVIAQQGLETAVARIEQREPKLTPFRVHELSDAFEARELEY